LGALTFDRVCIELFFLTNEDTGSDERRTRRLAMVRMCGGPGPVPVPGTVVEVVAHNLPPSVSDMTGFWRNIFGAIDRSTKNLSQTTMVTIDHTLAF
jgi:hypothetical protein